MKYSRLLDYIKNALQRETTSVSASDSLQWATRYYKCCEDLQRQSKWIWSQTYIDATVDSDGFITLPYKAASFPTLIEDQQSDKGGIPVLGMTKQYHSHVYNISAGSSILDRYVQHSFTTSSEYSGTIASYNTSTYVCTDSAGTYTADELIGKAVKINGEETWYLITDNDATTFTLDRAYRELGDTATTPDCSSLTYEIEPAGCPKLYFPEGSGSLRLWYPLRFRPAVNESDDCGWDARLDSIMPDYIIGMLLVTSSGDAEVRQNGHILIEYAKKGIAQLIVGLEDPGSVENQRFHSVNSPFIGDYSPSSLFNGISPRNNLWRN